MILKERLNRIGQNDYTPLHRIYESVPTGTCKSCTACCSESVNISFLEFSNVVQNGILKLPPQEMDVLSKKIITYYLTEWVKPQKCPFLDDQKLCMIYEARPLPCRLFGTATREAYENNYRHIQVQNLKVAKMLAQNEKIMLSESVRNKKIEFCEDFIPVHTLDEEAIQGLYDQLINLDGQLFFKGIIDDSYMNQNIVNLTLSYLLSDVSEIIDMDQLHAIKCEIAKRL